MKLCAFVAGGSDELRLGLLRDHVVIDVHAAHVTSMSGIAERRAEEISWNIVPPDLLMFVRNGRIARSALNKALARLGPAIDFLGLESPVGGRIGYPASSVERVILTPAVTPGAEGWTRSSLSLPWVADEEPAYWHNGSPTAGDVRLAAVIGRAGRDISEDTAWEYVAGYVTDDDRSLLVTPDELHPSDGADVYCDVAEAVAEASRHHELNPGDIVNVATAPKVVDVREPAADDLFAWA